MAAANPTMTAAEAETTAELRRQVGVIPTKRSGAGITTSGHPNQCGKLCMKGNLTGKIRSE